MIPGRDNKTLEPLGHYFLVFSSDAAARAYLEQTIRLHKISKSHNRGWTTSLPTPSTYLKKGENLQAQMRGFSLVPAHGQLFLRAVHRPYRPAMSTLLKNGGPSVMAAQQRRAEDMVLFSVDEGFRVDDIRAELRADGRRRNLHWKLAGHDRDIVKLDAVDPGHDLGPSTSPGRHVEAELKEKPLKRSVPAASRFVIAFKDRHEARRFVREWHRSRLPLQRDLADGEPATIANAEILW